MKILKPKVKVNFRIPRRLYQVILDIRHKFIDPNANDPYNGASTRALEYILQYYLNSEDYLNMRKQSQEIVKQAIEYIHKKDMEDILKKMNRKQDD